MLFRLPLPRSIAHRPTASLDPLREPVTGLQRWLGIGIVVTLSGIAGAALVGLYAAFVQSVAARALERGESLVPAHLLASVPLGVLVAAGVASLAWHVARTRRELDELARAARHWADGDPLARADLPARPLTGPLASLLHRSAALAATTQAMLRDRDQQLATSRELGGLYYWESDAAGRYTRIEMPHQGRRTELARLAGTHPWDDGARPIHGEWDDHRQQRAALAPFAHLVERRGARGDVFYMLEAGQPRLAADGSLAGWAGTMRELTDEVAEAERQQLAHDALAGSSEGIVLVQATASGGWRARWANDTAARLLGGTVDALAAADPACWFADPALAGRLGDALRDARPWRGRATLRGEHGVERVVALRLEPGRAPGRADAFAILCLDAREPELERLRGSFVASEKLRREASARSLDLEVTAHELESFSYTVSHDLRGPLRVVEGFARIVQEDYGHALDRMGNEHLRRILSASQRMNAMIDALLALSRLTANPVEPRDIDLTALALSVVDDLRAVDPASRARVDIAPGLHARGDEALLRLVLQNLLGNAWKYSGKQAAPAITLSVATVDGRPVFCVADNGVGFDMRFADRLFTVFQRLHSASDFPGTGVGLATVQRIIRRHGGRVWAESAPGQGARFYFTVWERDPASTRH